jgi:hypothetical protein
MRNMAESVTIRFIDCLVLQIPSTAHRAGNPILYPGMMVQSALMPWLGQDISGRISSFFREIGSHSQPVSRTRR